MRDCFSFRAADSAVVYVSKLHHMKKIHALVIAALTGVASVSIAADKPTGDLATKNKPAEQSESQIIAKARDNYPLKTCIVSDEALENLSEATAHVHREAGKSERVIFVCFGEDVCRSYQRALSGIAGAVFAG